VRAAGKLVLQSPLRQKLVVARLVVVAEVVVELVAVKFWRVVDALVKVCAPPHVLLVVVPKPREITFELKRIGNVAEIGAW
jgi:hypothetical protein